MPDYRDYAPWLEARYGQRVYKVPLNIPGGTCPNRDGTGGNRGLYFLRIFWFWISVFAGQYEYSENNGLRIKHFYERRFHAHKFISYLQTYTNTYMSLERFRRSVLAAADDPDLVGIAISTRPDCVNDAYLGIPGSVKTKQEFRY